MNERKQREHEFTWSGGTDSNEVELGSGAWGTLLVPTGSELIGRTLQFVAVSSLGLYQPTPLLATAKTLVVGANPLTQEEGAAVGGVGRCLLRLNSNTTGRAVLLWKD